MESRKRRPLVRRFCQGRLATLNSYRSSYGANANVRAMQLNLSTTATLVQNYLAAVLGGRCREVSIRVMCMDRRKVGTKNPGRYREVAVSGGSTVV